MNKTTKISLDLDLVEVDSLLEKLDIAYSLLLEAVTEMGPNIRTQMEELDQFDVVYDDNAKKNINQNKSLLFNIATQVKELDGYFLKMKLREKNLDELLKELSGIIDVKYDVIVSKTGAPKKTSIEMFSDRNSERNNEKRNSEKRASDRRNSITRPRRLSFVSTKYSDTDEFITKTRLREMSDLDYLFMLNAYRLPYCEKNDGRSMYESFFDQFIRLLVREDEFKDEDGFRYMILQECVFIIHIFTEFTVSIIECIIEIINVINTRIKTLSLNIDMNLNLREISEPIMDYIITCFNDENKIYYGFKNKKLVSAISDRDQEILDGREMSKQNDNINWSSKISDYNKALEECEKLYTQNCIAFTQKIGELKTIRDDQDPRIASLLINIAVFIDNFHTFLTFTLQKGNPYRQMFYYAIEVFQVLESLQKRFPVKYGKTPRSGRSSRSGSHPFYRTPSSNSIDLESPRDRLSPRKNISPRAAQSPKRRSSNPAGSSEGSPNRRSSPYSSDREDIPRESKRDDVPRELSKSATGLLSKLAGLIGKH